MRRPSHQHVLESLTWLPIVIDRIEPSTVTTLWLRCYFYNTNAPIQKSKWPSTNVVAYANKRWKNFDKRPNRRQKNSLMKKIALRENRAANALPPQCIADKVVRQPDGPRRLSDHDECMARVGQHFMARLGRTRLSEHRLWFLSDSRPAGRAVALAQIVRDDLA